ncbi:MAG: response regulator [Nitrospiraceae bacterium]|nr:response regulator [Nitrospiraceae bacterium]
MKILVVDDEQLVRWFLERALTRLGHSVKAVSSGAEAITTLDGGGFDLMLTDLRMPGENGSTLISKVGEIPEQKRPRIIVCSAYITSEIAEDYKNGGIGVLRKPFKLEELENAISAVSGIA